MLYIIIVSLAIIGFIGILLILALLEAGKEADIFMEKMFADLDKKIENKKIKKERKDGL